MSSKLNLTSHFLISIFSVDMWCLKFFVVVEGEIKNEVKDLAESFSFE